MKKLWKEKKMKNKYFLLSLLLLSSCAINSGKVVPNGIDHSGTWNDNYYSYFNESLKSRTMTKVILDQDHVFTSYSDPYFKTLEKDADKYEYTYDFDHEKSFSQNKKISLANEKIKDGFISKLYDGQMFCHGYFELARVQINENGFSASLEGKLNKADYFYLNFKSALDFKSEHVEPHLADITLTISLYGKNNYSFSCSLKDVKTNYQESPEAYTFYGFDLKGYDLTDVTDYSVSYHLDYDAYKEETGKDIKHALLLYELGFANPIFN